VAAPEIVSDAAMTCPTSETDHPESPHNHAGERSGRSRCANALARRAAVWWAVGRKQEGLPQQGWAGQQDVHRPRQRHL